MKDMGKEIVSGLIFIAGVGVVAVGAEASLPLLATAGAISALGAGVYSAVSAPRKRKIVVPPPPPPPSGHSEREQARTLVGKY